MSATGPVRAMTVNAPRPLPNEPERPQEEKRLPLGHDFEPCGADGECEWDEGFSGACHHGLIVGPVCGQPRAAHLPPHESEE
jgi:hypothetical protein